MSLTSQLFELMQEDRKLYLDIRMCSRSGCAETLPLNRETQRVFRAQISGRVLAEYAGGHRPTKHHYGERKTIQWRQREAKMSRYTCVSRNDERVQWGCSVVGWSSNPSSISIWSWVIPNVGWRVLTSIPGLCPLDAKGQYNSGILVYKTSAKGGEGGWKRRQVWKTKVHSNISDDCCSVCLWSQNAEDKTIVS